MANFDIYFPIEEKSEGAAYENDPNDECTRWGMVVDDLHMAWLDENKDGLYTCADLQLLTRQDAAKVLKKIYWDYCKADYINNQSVAMYIVDSGLVQGKELIIRYVQQILGVTIDGIIGSVTLLKINNFNQQLLFSQLKQKRIDRFNAIVAANPKKKMYLNGWLNRANNIKFAQ